MTYKISIIGTILSLLALSACGPGGVRKIVQLEPTGRQQLYVREATQPPGILCGVNTSGLAPPVFQDLSPDAVVVGYESASQPDGERPRCRSNVAIDHHGWLVFGLEPIREQAPSQLVGAFVSGATRPYGQTINCPAPQSGDHGRFVAGMSLNGGVLSGMRPADSASDTAHAALPARPIVVDGRTISFRESATDGARDYPWRTSGLPLTLTAEDVAHVVSAIEGRFDTARRFGDFIPVFFIGAENPSADTRRQCLLQLHDIRLNLIFETTRD